MYNNNKKKQSKSKPQSMQIEKRRAVPEQNLQVEKKKQTAQQQVQLQNQSTLNYSLTQQSQLPIFQQSQQSILGEFEAINNAVHEYLLKRNLLNTLHVFQQEIAQPNNPVYDQDQKLDHLLMSAFDQGDYDFFIQRWLQFVPQNIRQFDTIANKLEFYFQIYFTIYNIHPYFKINGDNMIDNNSLNNFKNYLDNQGADLSKTSEFLPFYALPYIKKPKEHPAFKHIFTKEWIIELRNKLSEFLLSLYNTNGLLVLQDMYRNYVNKINCSENNDNYNSSQITQNSNEKNVFIQNLEKKNKDLLDVLQEYDQKYNQLQLNYRDFADQTKQNMMESQNKWCALSKELMSIINESFLMVSQLSNGFQINGEIYQNLLQKSKKYEKFLNSNFEEIIQQSQDVSLFDQKTTIDGNSQNSYVLRSQPREDFFGAQTNVQRGKQSNDNTEQSQILNDQEYILQPLNFVKIMTYFLQPKDYVTVGGLLQALRQRITQAKSASQRRIIVTQYTQNDLIGCMNYELRVVQDNLLNSQNDIIREQALRLLNAMASDYYGRYYLINSDYILKILIQIIRKENYDNSIRRNALGTLQKLSLRRKSQKIMIQENMIRTIIQIIKREKEVLSEYSYEYLTALLMNLSLRKEGRDKCENPEEGVLETLNELIEHENMQVRTFVNGMLYSLFSRQVLREQAKAMGMQDILLYLLENSDSQFNKQIQYILDQLMTDKQDYLDEYDQLQDEEDTDVDDLDDDEEIGDEDESIEDKYIEGLKYSGEELLIKEFSINKNIENTSKEYIHKNTDKQSKQNIMRPMTPQQNNYVQKNIQEAEELISRDKLARTPVGRESRPQSYKQQEKSKKDIQIEIQEQDQMNNSEFLKAFLPRPKVPRTPPNENN